MPCVTRRSSWVVVVDAGLACWSAYAGRRRARAGRAPQRRGRRRARQRCRAAAPLL